MLPQSKRPSYLKTNDIRDNISSNNTMQAPSQNWFNYNGNTDNLGYVSLNDNICTLINLNRSK